MKFIKSIFIILLSTVIINQSWASASELNSAENPNILNKKKARQKWIDSLKERLPKPLSNGETVFDWWPLADNMVYTYKISYSLWEEGKKWVGTEFDLKILSDKENKNKFNFEVQGFEKFPYQGLVIESNRVFLLQDSKKEPKEPLLVFPLFAGMLFINEKDEQEYLNDVIRNTTDDSFYGPNPYRFWSVGLVEGNRYNAIQVIHRPLYYTFEKHIGLTKWYVPDGYELTLVKLNGKDFIQPGYVKDGLVCTLRGEKITWRKDEAVKLFADVENKGRKKFSVSFAEIELDINGQRYKAGLESTLPVSFPSGKKYSDIEIKLDKPLRRKDTNKKITLSTGDYNIYMIAKARPADSNKNEPVYLVSNPVKIQMISDKLAYSINPDELCVGQIHRLTTKKELILHYGVKNIVDDNIPIGEGDEEPGTVVFPKDPARKLEILWYDPNNQSLPKAIFISGIKSKWHLENGITLGTTLLELEKLNGKPFVLTGFGWDYSGTIIEWKNGNLKKILGDLRPPENRKVLLRLGQNNENLVTKKESRSVGSDRPFSSGHPVMQKLNPAVYEIEIEFPENNNQP
jgi:hypothetical protein